MNKSIKKKWVSALRSRKYKQTKGCLKRGDTYCCLGVLCDLYIQEHDSHWNKDDTFKGCDLVLPTDVAKWAGITDNICVTNPSVVINVGQDDECKKCLGEANDNGLTFKEIADIIESQL